MSDENEVPSEGPKLGSWGLWSLDLFEGMVRASHEASGIERFEKIGEAFHKLSQGRTALTYFCMTLEGDEKLLVEGPEPRLLFIEDMIGFTKMGDGFLEAKEEIKVIRKRMNALLLFHKFALRLERCFAIGLTLHPEVPAAAVQQFALLMRESPLPNPQEDHQRVLDEMRKRGITGIDLFSKGSLVTGLGMESATRLMLTLMAKAATGVPDDELPAWAVSYQRLAGTQVAQDIVGNLHHVAQGSRLESMQAAFLAAMEAPDLVTWRTKLEEQGSQLASELVKESDPNARQEIEGRLKGLSKLLDRVTHEIPAEMLADEQAKRMDKSQDRQSEQQQVAAALLADPIVFLKKMSSEREQGYYERSLSQCVEAFPVLVSDHVMVARLVIQALQAHLRPVPEVAWRAEIAGRTLKELVTDRNLQKFLEAVLTPDKPETKDHARAALVYCGALAYPFLVSKLDKPATDEAGHALQALATGILRDQAQQTEAYLAAKLGEPGCPPLVAKVALDVVGVLKKADRLEVVSRFANHTDLSVRESALRTMALLDPIKGQAHIKRSIGDRDFNIAKTAILLMGELKTQDWAVILQFLETIKRREKDVPEPEERLQIVTAQALGLLGNIPLRTGGSLEDHLLDLVQEQQQAKKLLGLGGGSGKFKEKSSNVRAAVCEALGHVGGDKTLLLMRKLALNDSHEAVKAKARDAVKAINARLQVQKPAGRV